MHHSDVRIALERGELALETPRHPPVVGVAKRDELALRELHRRVPRDGLAAMLSPHVPDARVVVTVEEIGRAVRRAVVHDDELEVAERLPEDARDRVVQVVRSVVRDDRGTDQRHAIERIPRSCGF